MIKLNFYFKTDAKLNVAVDTETGEGAEAYLKASTDVNKEPTEKEVLEAEKAFKTYLANELEVDGNLIYPITEKEYLENTEEED